MDSIGPSGHVTSSTGDVDLEGQLVGLVRECGTSLKPYPWKERPGFYDRVEAAGEDPEAIRRMIRAGQAVQS
jgi:hypothetical protein